MKPIKMQIQKSSRPLVVLLAAVVVILTSMVVANATQTITTPNAAFMSFSLSAGRSSATITPATNKSVLIMGCCTTSGSRAVGQVSLLHIPGGGMSWTALEANTARGNPDITRGYNATTAGTHIVWIDLGGGLDIEVAGADTIYVHEYTGFFPLAGNVTLIW
jgi:hypothetical protein